MSTYLSYHSLFSLEFFFFNKKRNWFKKHTQYYWGSRIHLLSLKQMAACMQTNIIPKAKLMNYQISLKLPNLLHFYIYYFLTFEVKLQVFYFMHIYMFKSPTHEPSKGISEFLKRIRGGLTEKRCIYRRWSKQQQPQIQVQDFSFLFFFLIFPFEEFDSAQAWICRM